MSVHDDSFEPKDLVERLAELSGHFGFYARDLKRLSREVSKLAVDVAQRFECDEPLTEDQYKRGYAFSHLFSEGCASDYDFGAAGVACARIWATLQVIEGTLFYVNDSLMDAEEVAAFRASTPVEEPT